MKGLQFYEVNFYNTVLSMAGKVWAWLFCGEKGIGKTLLLHSVPALLV
jgi:hypothetical protein